MKRKLFLALSLAASLALMNACDDDSGKKAKCGDGTLDAGEACDGSKFAEGAKVCPDGKEIDNIAKFTCDDKCEVVVGEGACKDQEQEQKECGNKKLDAGEACDGSEFAEGAKVCPDGQRLVDEDKFTCSNDCEVEINDACVDICNINGILDEGEACDGSEFAEGAKVCPFPDQEIDDDSKFSCNDKCEVVVGDGACKDKPKEDPNLIFSELVYNVDDEGTNQYIIYEIANLGEKINLKDCRLQAVDLNEVLGLYEFVAANPKVEFEDKDLDKDEVYVVCAKRNGVELGEDLTTKCSQVVEAASDLKTNMFACLSKDEVEGFENADALAIICKTDEEEGVDIVEILDVHEYCASALAYMGNNLIRVCTDKGTGKNKPETSGIWVGVTDAADLGAYKCSEPVTEL
ncbi:MAG: hypothetical protein WC966_10770 [Bradymonadales bacterium]